jgi:hypothetical protein
MDLVNQTPFPASLSLSKVLGSPDVRAGLLIAKASFHVDGQGQVVLSPDPFGVLAEDEETELGVLPADTHPREGTELEVMLLGAAYAPGGRPVPSMQVSLTIAHRTWRLAVTGDRHWIGAGPDARPSEPDPFVRMPLGWERAFGGRCDVELDPHTVMEVMDPRNPEGRGFDAEALARGFAEHVGVPEGYPRFPLLRRLPNVEHPEARVESFADRPEPCSWAPRLVSMIRPTDDPKELERMARGEPVRMPVGWLRSAPGMVLPAAPLGTPVRATGVLPSGREWSFVLPAFAIHADYVLGERHGSKPLVAQRLVLLPEESRFYLVFRMDFRMKVDEGMERSFRLRVA